MKTTMLPAAKRTEVTLSQWLTIVCTLLVLITATLVNAASQDITVEPAVIDEQAKPRDILKESIAIKNTTSHKIRLFPIVRENSVGPGETLPTERGAPELSAALTNWIELPRGIIDLEPGEQKIIPFIVRVNLNAIAGTYHAHITFADGDTRDEAESAVPLADVLLSVEIKADIKEILQLNKFTTDSIVFTGDDVLFKYQLQNIGNRELQPTGDIRIYDRRGEEVAAVDVNKEGRIITPDQSAQLATVWSAVHGFGKYKALLNVNYGAGQTAAVQDTVFFWVVPWKEILGLLVVSLVAIIFLALYFRRKLEEKHLGKLAHAGLLKAEAFVHLPHLGAPTPAPVQPVQRLKDAVPRSVIMPKERDLTQSPQPTTLPKPRELGAPKEQPEIKPEDSRGGTINLKNLRHESHVELQDSHIINLKKDV